MAAKSSKHDENTTSTSDIVESGSSTGFEDVSTSEDMEHDTAARKAMLAHIAASKAFIKSQQRGEDDLSPKEKLSILSELLDHKPAIFLERFHKFLREEDLDVFKDLSGDYEVAFYLQEARKRLGAGKSQTGVRNRRYEALKKLEQEGTYFGDKAMKDRDPLMFEEYIGQYMTQEERKGLLKPIDHSDMKLSSILMTFMDEQETKELYQRQKEEEDDMMEEEEEDEDDEDDSEDDAATASSSHRQTASKPAAEREPTPASEEEKAMMRQEFLHHMHLRFLSGQEKDFDYSTVDGNAEYDSLVLRTQDEEEHYFDDEEEENWSLGENERTGDGKINDNGLDDTDPVEMGGSVCRTDDTKFCSTSGHELCTRPKKRCASDLEKNDDMET